MFTKALGYFNKHAYWLFPVFLMSFLPLYAFAADAPAPDFSAIVMAIWSGIQNHASSAMWLMLGFQLLRTNEVVGLVGKLGLQGNKLRVFLAVVATGGYVATALQTGQSILQALVTGLFTSGGAMLIYQAIASVNDHASDPGTPAA